MNSPVNPAPHRSASANPGLAALADAAAREPGNAQAHAALAVALQREGQLAQALDSHRRALALDPGLTGLHALMAPVLRALDRHDEAVVSYRAALRLQPRNPALHAGLSASLLASGDPQGAAAAAREACALAPREADHRLALAAAQHAMGEFDQAIDSLAAALALQPDNLAAQTDLAATLARRYRHDEAVGAYRRALELAPDNVDLMANLGAALVATERREEAAALYQRALALCPDHPVLLREMGLAQQLLGNDEQAVDWLERAARLDPDDVLSHTYLGYALHEMGRHAEALTHYRRAAELSPDSPDAYSMMLFALSHTTEDPAELLAAHLGFAERWERPVAGQRRPHPNGRDPARRLNVGFVSGDLCNHAVASFVEPILALLGESAELSLYAYYNNPNEDVVTQRFRQSIPNWRPIAGLDDDAVEALVRADGIDILVDMHGHTPRHRLTLFARKPAPVQATWIGYAGTTGLQAVDYYITDGFRAPEGLFDDQFSEKIARLPLVSTFQPSPVAPPLSPLPALANGYLTFGSFHRASKLSRKVIAQWATLLRAIPDARLVIGGIHRGARGVLQGWLDEEGIAHARVDLHERTNMADYLAMHAQIDICLSPFPYTGATTVCHALWMGVPTLATTGPTNPSHSVACYLAHLRLDMFIAPDEATFVQLGVMLSQNLAELAALRAGMRERFNASLVGHPVVAAAGMQQALRVMWQRWCAGEAPSPLRVTLADLGIAG